MPDPADGDIATPCPVNAQRAVRQLPHPAFEITVCDLKTAPSDLTPSIKR